MKDNMFSGIIMFLLLFVSYAMGILVEKNHKHFPYQPIQQGQVDHDKVHVKSATGSQKVKDLLRYNDCYVCHEQQEGCYRDKDNNLWCPKER